MSDLGKSVASAIKVHFGSVADTFNVQDISEGHPRGVSVLFTLYRYVDCRFNYELGRGGFIAQSVHGGHLLGPDLVEADLHEIIARPDRLTWLDELVRLRIPDKYLAAEPWLETPSRGGTAE